MSITKAHQIAACLEKDLDQQLSSLRRGVRLLTGLGLVVFFALLIYFSYVVNIIQHEIRAKDLAKVAGAFTSDFLVVTLKNYTHNLSRQAPDYAGNLLDTALVKTMELSRESRFAILGWLDERLSDVEKLVTRTIDLSYEQHVGDLKLLVKDIKTPHGKQAFEEYFSSLLTAPLASESVKVDIESFDLTLASLHDRLQRLVQGTGLTPPEATERDILLAFREYWERFKTR